jgi:hypothetical protein
VFDEPVDCADAEGAAVVADVVVDVVSLAAVVVAGAVVAVLGVDEPEPR